jgi:hypothetical protein
MKTKTFKIGEYAIGGIIQVTISENKIEIGALDWNTKRVIKKELFTCMDSSWRLRVSEYLEDLTSYYYAEKILTWIKNKI